MGRIGAFESAQFAHEMATSATDAWARPVLHSWPRRSASESCSRLARPPGDGHEGPPDPRRRNGRNHHRERRTKAPGRHLADHRRGPEGDPPLPAGAVVSALRRQRSGGPRPRPRRYAARRHHLGGARGGPGGPGGVHRRLGGRGHAAVRPARDRLGRRGPPGDDPGPHRSRLEGERLRVLHPARGRGPARGDRALRGRGASC
jgi:hypothetical protein